MKAYMKFIRWPNLAIIILTQLIFYYWVLARWAGQDLMLDIDQFIVLMILTVLIALAGYVINDLFDIETDQVNQKRTGLSEYPFGKEQLKIIYIILSAFVLFMSAWFAYYTGQSGKASIFILIHILLFLYSYKLKKVPLAGNVLVGVLSALVVIIVYF